MIGAAMMNSLIQVKYRWGLKADFMGWSRVLHLAVMADFELMKFGFVFFGLRFIYGKHIDWDALKPTSVTPTSSVPIEIRPDHASNLPVV